MQELLFELGCEELPASFVRRAYEQLEREIVARLDEANLGHGASQSLGTPRRLIVQVREIVARQPDQVKEMRGPSVKAAFDANGAPTPALQGFCRGQGVAPDDVRNDGEYVWVSKTIPGRDAREVLAEVLPQSVAALTFDKTMRWGSGRVRFARPIRWMLASLSGEVIPFAFEGVASGLSSRGHRFNAPEPFEAAGFAELLDLLRARDVEPDPAVRERKIREGAMTVATGSVELTDGLVDENVFLTEWPVALEGSFREDFLELPAPVLVTAMAKHERFFPIRDAAGRITNRFVSIRNGGVDEVVRAGNAWVLNARFNDAKFFFDEDKKSNLDEFLAKTEGMMFQEKLGSVRKRADRLARLAESIARSAGAGDEEAGWARQAGLYAKADLTCGLVSELPSLQGVIGAEYARREGMPEPVCTAIAAQYSTPRETLDRTGTALLLADQLDKLAGYLGVGLAPSGSSDPYGLRRSATILVESSWIGSGVDLSAAFDAALKGYAEQGIDVDRDGARLAIEALFESRYVALLPEVRHDVLAAAVAGGVTAVLDPVGVRFRVGALALCADDEALVQTARRPQNIVEAAIRKGQWAMPDGDPLDSATGKLDSAEGVALETAVRDARPTCMALREAEDAVGLLVQLRGLADPINRFFDATMVMVDDAATRNARLSLLAGCGGLLGLVCDFSKLEG